MSQPPKQGKIGPSIDRHFSRRPQRHAIGVASRRTGLSADLIRAWERRYAAVRPTRTAGGHRCYTDADIERLRLLNEAVGRGHAIGRIADRSDRELEAILATEHSSLTRSETPIEMPDHDRGAEAIRRVPSAQKRLATILVGECLAAIEALDTIGLERCLERASISLSRLSVIEQLIVPVMYTVGERWHDGDLRPVHEHLASSAIRSFLGMLRNSHAVSQRGPCLVITTPQHQHHEIGALVAASVASADGWHTLYLGPNLPPEEIVAAVRQVDADAIALSVTYPPDDSSLEDDLRYLRRHLTGEFPIIVGGYGAAAYRPIVDEVEATLAGSLAEFRDLLTSLQTGRPESHRVGG